MNKTILARVICSIVCLLSSTQSFAQKSESTKLSFREMALAESKVKEGETRQSASDAQVTGAMLTLKDPTPEVEQRSWKYFVGATLQQFQPQGRVFSDLSQNFDLGKNGSTLMPGLELGVFSPTFAMGSMNLGLGAKVKGSYSSQSTTAVMASGFVIEDARLNTSLLSVGPAVSLSMEDLNWLSLNLGAQFGDLTYTQTSSNEFARFSQHASYEAFSYGLGFQVSRHWSVTADWNQRSLRGSNSVALQNNNFELGTQIVW